MDPYAKARIFVSHATDDAALVGPVVELLRTHYLDTFYSPRDIRGGYWLEDIERALAGCHWFAVLLSPAALTSKWVREEVRLALAERHLKGKVVPVLIAPCEWKTIHPDLRRYQLFDLTGDDAEPKRRLLDHLGVVMQEYPQFQVGDVKVPVYILVGGDGRTRYGADDVLCDGPRDRPPYVLPPDVQALSDAPDGPLARKRSDAERRGQVFFNNPQVRLDDASWGGPSPTGGLTNTPLRLKLGWTEYFHTVTTNMATDAVLPSGRTIAQEHQGPVDSFVHSRLSNPLAVNLSLVTADGFIYFAQRSQYVAWNTGGLQPAVSGDGQREDVDAGGVYSPFRTAVREAQEEATGLLVPTPAMVTFFGLARTLKTRFPFLFGELRVPWKSKLLDAQEPTASWEGKRQRLPFTVEAVCDWVRDHYLDQLNRRASAAIGTTLFSLLMSLKYEWPNRWLEVVEKLDLS